MKHSKYIYIPKRKCNDEYRSTIMILPYTYIMKMKENYYSNLLEKASPSPSSKTKYIDRSSAKQAVKMDTMNNNIITKLNGEAFFVSSMLILIDRSCLLARN